MLIEHPADLVILVDSPTLHLPMARQAKAAGCPVRQLLLTNATMEGRFGLDDLTPDFDFGAPRPPCRRCLRRSV